MTRLNEIPTNRLYCILSETNDKHLWIRHHLLQYRKKLIEKLFQTFNARPITDELVRNESIAYLYSLANEEQLGLPSIEDPIHLKTKTKKQLKTFFYKHKQALITDYENNLLNVLSDALLNELLREIYVYVDPTNYDNLILITDRMRGMYAYLDQLLALSHEEANELLPLEPIAGSTCSINKDVFLEKLQSLLKNALLKHGFLREPGLLHHSSLNDVPKHLHHDFNRINELHTLSFNDNPNHAKTMLQQSIPFIATYPEVLAGLILLKPSLIESVPNALKNNPRVVKCIIEKIDKKNQFNPQDYTKTHRTLIKHQSNNAHYLSSETLSSDELNAYVLKRDGLLLENMNEQVRDDKELVRLAVRQNPLALIHASERLQNDIALRGLASINGLEIGLESRNQASLLEQSIACYKQKFNTRAHYSFEKLRYYLPNLDSTEKPKQLKTLYMLQAIDTLLKPQVNRFEFLNSTNVIPPELLSEVISYREANGALPLPFCRNTKRIKKAICDLNQTIYQNGSAGFEQKYATVHEAIGDFYMQHPYAKAQDCPPLFSELLNTKYWFIGMLRHEKKHASPFMDLLKIGFQLLKSTLKLLLSIGAVVGAYVLTSFLGPIGIMLISAGLLVYQGWKNKKLGDFLKQLAWGLLVGGAIWLLLTTLVPFAVEVIAMYSIFMQSLNAIYYTFKSLFSDKAHDDLSLLFALDALNFFPYFTYFLPHYLTLATSIYNTFLFTVLSIPFVKWAWEGLQETINHTINLFKHLKESLFGMSIDKAPLEKELSLETQTEQAISRLQLSTESSANEKGDLLYEIYDDIKAELNDDPVLYDDRNHSLSNALKKKRIIHHKGTNYRLSFFDVAATKRDNKDHFEPRETRPAPSFFNRPTTTEKMIFASRSDLQAAQDNTVAV